MIQPKCNVIFDLTDCPLFPPYGENRTHLTHSEKDVTLDIFFDGASDNEAHISFTFFGVSQVLCGSFPGVAIPSLSVADAGSLSKLVQIERSDIAKKWTAYWSGRGLDSTQHYQIALTAANKIYDILARDVKITLPE